MTMLTRRTFLYRAGSAGIGLLAGGCEIEDVARLVDDLRADARIGILANVELVSQADVQVLGNAFRFYRQVNVDAVVVIGKPADRQDILKSAWGVAFGPDSKVLLIQSPDRRAEVGGFAFRLADRRPTRPDDVLTFCGEGRFALTDDLMSYDAELNVVYAGSMSGFNVPDGYSRNGRPVEACEFIGSAQGLLVSVYSSKVVIRRLDFTESAPPRGSLAPGQAYAEDLAPELTLPREGRMAKAPSAPPEFWADTVLRVIPGYSGTERVYTVQWPAVQRRFTGMRAHSYEVSVHRLAPGATKPSRAVRRRNVLSECFYKAEVRDAKPVKCLFRREDLVTAAGADTPVVISVTPLGAFGDRGKSVFSEPFRP